MCDEYLGLGRECTECPRLRAELTRVTAERDKAQWQGSKTA